MNTECSTLARSNMDSIQYLDGLRLRFVSLVDHLETGHEEKREDRPLRDNESRYHVSGRETKSVMKSI